MVLHSSCFPFVESAPSPRALQIHGSHHGGTLWCGVVCDVGNDPTGAVIQLQLVGHHPCPARSLIGSRHGSDQVTQVREEGQDNTSVWIRDAKAKPHNHHRDTRMARAQQGQGAPQDSG